MFLIPERKINGKSWTFIVAGIFRGVPFGIRLERKLVEDNGGHFSGHIWLVLSTLDLE